MGERRRAFVHVLRRGGQRSRFGSTTASLYSPLRREVQTLILTSRPSAIGVSGRGATPGGKHRAYAVNAVRERPCRSA